MPSEEEDFRRLAVELRLLEGTAEMLQSRINVVNAAITELTLAKRSLEGVEKEEEDAPLFVPVGGGSYIKAKLASADTVVAGIGTGVAVEKTVEAARETVENRMSELEDSRRKLKQQLVQVAQKIQQDRAELEEVTKKLAKRRGRTTGVRKAESRA